MPGHRGMAGSGGRAGRRTADRGRPLRSPGDRVGRWARGSRRGAAGSAPAGVGATAHLPSPTRTGPRRTWRRSRLSGRRVAGPRPRWRGAMNRTIRGRVVTPEGIIERGTVRVEDGRIPEVADIGDGEATGAWILPGFVDL